MIFILESLFPVNTTLTIKPGYVFIFVEVALVPHAVFGENKELGMTLIMSMHKKLEIIFMFPKCSKKEKYLTN